MRVQGNTQRHPVLTIIDAVFNDIVHHFFVLVVLFKFLLTSATLDVSLNALVHQYLSELVFGRFDVEFPSRLERIFKCLIIVIEVEK